MTDLRFGVNLFGIGDLDAFRAKCRRAEQLGFDILNVPDHLHAPSPFSTAVAAAYATQGARVGTHVLNIAFWNTARLADEIATADQLTGGRLDVGLGGGTVKSEFDEAGIGWQPIGARLERLDAAITELDRIFAKPPRSEGTPQVVQQPRPPILVGASGERALRVAARHADILGFGGVSAKRGGAAGELELMTAPMADDRMAYFRSEAGERAERMQFSLLVQAVRLTEDRRAVAEELSRDDSPALSADDVLEAPGMLIGTVDEVVGQLHERRKRYGFTYFSVHEPSMEQMGEVITALRG